MIFQKARWTSILWAVVGLAACGGDDSSSDTCKPGAAGCECLKDNVCDDNLTCTDGKCAGTFDVGVAVSDPAARACDVLLSETTAQVSSVGFDESVKGSYVRQAPKVAVSFVSAKDAPISGSGISLKLVGSGTDGIEVVSTKCADAQGKALDDVTVALRN